MPKPKRRSKHNPKLKVLRSLEELDSKACPCCLQTKPLAEFYRSVIHRKGVRSCCKVCDKECSKKHRKTRRGKPRASHLKRRYGITEADYERMLTRQGSACAICRSKNSGIKDSDKFAVDHDHKTGRVRGLLCTNCNKGLGCFKDNPNFMWTTIEYLAKSNAS